MSDFLDRVGRIAEWTAVSNLTNRAVNAGCEKVGDMWKNRKEKKHKSHGPPSRDAAAAAATPPPPGQPYQQGPYPPYSPQQQASYMPPAPPMPGNQLLVSINHFEGPNQWGPLIAVLECNHQRYQTPLGQAQQQFAFPVYQFDYDQLFVWIQTENQAQTIAHGEIPVRVLLNNNQAWSPAQQRWIPLRDQYNGPAGQLLINFEYRSQYASSPSMHGYPAPPPYSYQ